MARAMWKGSISFGLVTIPVSLFPATSSHDLAFKMLDTRDFEPVHMERKNAEDEVVPWDDVVKGYEYEEGRYVVLTDEDLRRANVEATQTIDITSFVDESAVDPVYMLMIARNLGPEYSVWDTRATVHFKKAGRGKLYARFQVAAEELETIRQLTAAVRERVVALSERYGLGCSPLSTMLRIDTPQGQ